MAWIKITGITEATGLLKELYDAAIRRAGRVFNIVRIQSVNPATLNASMELYQQVMLRESPVPRSLREMIATVVSRANDCHY